MPEETISPKRREIVTTNGLNTLEYAERLMRAGVPEEHAKAQAMVLYEIINSTLATKRDIADVQRDIKELDVKIETIRAELRKEIEQTRADLKKDIKTLDEKITYKMAAASAGVVLTILSCLITLGKLGLLTPTPTP